MRFSERRCGRTVAVAFGILLLLTGFGSPVLAGEPEVLPEQGAVCVDGEPEAAAEAPSLDFARMEAVQRLCCLDEWQGGSPCGFGKRRAAYCNNSCDGCGAYICVTSTTPCLK